MITVLKIYGDGNSFLPIVQKSTQSASWHVTSQNGFVVNGDTSDEQGQEIHDQNIILTTKRGKLFLNNKKIIGTKIVIIPQSGAIKLHDQTYDGSLVIMHEKKQITIQLIPNVKSVSLARQRSNDFTVRVLIDEQIANAPSWKLYSKKGFTIGNPLHPSKNYTTDASELSIKACTEGFIYINDKPLYTLQAYITPLGDSITVNGKAYCGGLWVLADGSSNKLVNCLGIEDYVACVLTTESWPGWSLEVNKVLAIACRTYVIAMVQNARVAKRPYHVRNTNKHQTYSGGNGMEIHRQAVAQTTGLFLSHNGNPITAMFDGCCGGVITKNMQGIDFKKASYLARSYPCLYCKDFNICSWQADYHLHELEKIFKLALPRLRKLKEVRIIKKDKAGIVQLVEVKGAGRLYTLSGKKIYSLLNSRVKSFYFSVEKNGHIITFKGKGYGHHLGLCQWGAKKMVQEGYNYRSVLEFYYPNTQLMRLI